MRIRAALAMSVLLAAGAAGEPVKTSDVITINLKGLTTPSITIPETGMGESKAVIDVSSFAGFVGRAGYILLCEAPMKKDVGCGPKNKFQGVSDILVRGTIGGPMRLPAYILFSDPFSSDPGKENDASQMMKDLYGAKIPDPLCPIFNPKCAPIGIAETGQPQELGAYFGFTRDNYAGDPAKAVVLQSDVDPAVPEPNTLALFAGLLAAASFFGAGRMRRAQARR